MPIRAENRGRYPADWPAISRRIRFARALGQCECAGECGKEHDAGRCPARHNGITARGAKIVLTVAHLDHTPENCDPANLKAMCQACHLAYDAAEHKATAARTRAAKIAASNTPLPGLEPAPPPGPAPVAAPRPGSTGAIPRRGHFPAKDGRDGVDFSLIPRVPETPQEQRDFASAYIASRARAGSWTRDEHERTLLALFQPPSDTLAAPEPDAKPAGFLADQARAPRPVGPAYWRDDAACRAADPRLFFGAGSDQTGIPICRGCSVVAPCLAEAMADPDLRGIWGGTTAVDRVALRGKQLA